MTAATERFARLGVDIGGTFTDATIVDSETGELRSVKVLTTPSDPSEGFGHAVRRAVAAAQVTAETVDQIVHATTVATNAIVEDKAARTAFITTAGFRDMFEIARQVRPSLYDLRFVKARPLIPRHLCFEVRERIDARGRVIVSLDESDVLAVATEIRRASVTAVAVCLLHSYVNPDHELRVEQLLRKALPEVAVSVSSAVSPEFREYVRASTTAINAAVSPIVARYLTRIEARLERLGATPEILVMQSNGGVYRAESACRNPAYMVESGPAAGVIAASYVGKLLGHADILSFDMGGTTAKVGLIEAGEARVTKEYEVGAMAHGTLGEGRGSGYPIRTPVIDLVEIGAGGGSIAWIDSGGGLRVGPRSAGADPGPACYGLGGTEPTVTDANLVLGRLNPAYFLGGEMELSREAASTAIEERCARPLGLSIAQAALSIVEIANAAMSSALRLVSVERGYDPRAFALMAFGGAGPAHANRIAAENEISTIIVPPSPGTISALGLLATDLKHEYSASFVRRLEATERGDLEAALDALEGRGRAELGRDGIRDDAMRFVRLVEMRYVGQGYELPMIVTDMASSSDLIRPLSERFHAEHERTHGFSAPGEPIETVAVRVTAIGRISKPQPPVLERAPTSDPSDALKAYRSVYFGETRTEVECPVYDRALFRAGSRVQGPAIVEEAGSTTVVHPGYQAETTDMGFLVLTQGQAYSAGVTEVLTLGASATAADDSEEESLM